jgi:hypothetical protein
MTLHCFILNDQADLTTASKKTNLQNAKMLEHGHDLTKEVKHLRTHLILSLKNVTEMSKKYHCLAAQKLPVARRG